MGLLHHGNVALAPPQSQTLTYLERTASPSSKTQFVIAIPSVARNKQSYLQHTLVSLLDGLQPHQREFVTIAVCLFNGPEGEEYNPLSVLEPQFRDTILEAIERGWLRILSPEDTGMGTQSQKYELLKNLVPNLGDAPDRMLWRSKQNLDFSAMLNYAHSAGEYVLVVEDDIIASQNFMEGILKVVKHFEEQNKEWIMLDFGTSGFIGKLFKSNDAGRLSMFLDTFYDSKPCDWLYDDFLNLRGQKGIRQTWPCLFDHRGLTSSLKGKYWKERDFDPRFVKVVNDETFSLAR